MNNPVESSFSPQARGKRLRSLRKALRFSRKEWGEKHGISPASIQNWEDARYGGLSEKGAKKMLATFQQEGITCTLEWLLYGVGNPPSLLQETKILPNENMTEETIIAQELQLFHRLNPNAVDCVLTDDSMLPYYQSGDWVAGIRYFDKAIAQITPMPVIVQCDQGILVRLLDIGSQKGLYSFSCSNAHTTAQFPLLKNINPFYVAPILWMRRKKLFDPCDS